MTNLQQTQHRAIDALSAITHTDRPWGAAPPNPELLEHAVDAIAEHTLALALERMAEHGCEASAEKLAAVFLADQPDRPPFPP